MAEPALPPLDKLDPHKAWQPWQPDARQPWDLKWAGHLYRRAAFGADLASLRQAVKDGLPATLDRLLDGQPDHEDRLKFLTFERTTAAYLSRGAFGLRAWWAYCMLHTKHPLLEKLTLFWHDHFATSVNKVSDVSLMLRQNLTLREHALGKFGPFLLAMSKDPAMLVWLDSNTNVKGAPNENYAREVMELFSLGVGNYTEQDVGEAARAFTGWHTDFKTFTFNANQHDDGAKTILKQTDRWNGDDVVRICLEQPACARFLTRKLYRHLVSEAEVPPDSFIEPLAESLRKSDYDIKALVRRMLASRHFFSAHAYRQRIKSPVEYVIGAVLTTTARPLPSIRPGTLAGRMEAMGQTLFAPPNVKGWPGAQTWLSTSTVLSRHNFAQTVASGGLSDRRGAALRPVARTTLDVPSKAPPEDKKEALPPPPPAGVDIARIVRERKADSPKAAVGVLLNVLLQGDISEQGRKTLAAHIGEGKPQGPAFDWRVREAAHLVMTMPEYQLC